MKKFLISLISALFVLSLGACKITTPPNNNEEPPQEEKPSENEPPQETIDEDLLLSNRIETILNNMSIKDKIGQMFMVGFEGTTIPSSLRQTVKNRRFGNFIYFGANVADDEKVAPLSSSLQNILLEEVGLPGFISMDQEGGMVVRFANEATHFIGNMGLVATNDPNNAFLVGQASGQELRHYGVNMNLAPSLDVNNNAQNPVIGIRSYADSAEVVSSYGLKMIAGLQDSCVLSVAKHFPGHGDTTIDSHLGLPLIPHDKERLYQVELAPFIDAINNGVDAIMSAHIIFSSFDDQYPATLSYKVLTELLRNELKFQGLILTDEMRMNAIRSNFGIKEAAVLAIQAGVDILLYAESTSTSLEAYDGVLSAYQSGIITEERINDSVRRILTKKLKYGLFENYQPFNNLKNSDFLNHQAFNKELVRKSITLAKGDVSWFNNEKATLLISSVCTRYPLIKGYQINTDNNSFANVGKIYLNEAGVLDVAATVIKTSLTNNEINAIVNKAKNYAQVVIAVENVSTSQANLINRLANENIDLVVVALKNPYDYLAYTNVKNYICTYGYFATSVEAVLDLLLGRFQAKGILPVKVIGLN